jgi:hypothetical protein
MGFSEVSLKCDFNRLTEKHLAIAIVLVPKPRQNLPRNRDRNCHETETEASGTRATSTQDKAPAATDKQTVKNYASVAVQAAKPKESCSTETGRDGPMRRQRNQAKPGPYMPARSIPHAEPGWQALPPPFENVLAKLLRVCACIA